MFIFSNLSSNFSDEILSTFLCKPYARMKFLFFSKSFNKIKVVLFIIKSSASRNLIYFIFEARIPTFVALAEPLLFCEIILQFFRLFFSLSRISKELSVEPSFIKIYSFSKFPVCCLSDFMTVFKYLALLKTGITKETDVKI